MYKMDDYREALRERDNHEIGSARWKFNQMKVQGIVTAMVAENNPQMVWEVVSELYSLNDCGASFDDDAVQHDLWILESNGYSDMTQPIRELDWC